MAYTAVLIPSSELQIGERLGAGIIRCGNLDPVAVIQELNAERISQITGELCRKEKNKEFILSGGCEITVNTPVENLKAMREASQ